MTATPGCGSAQGRTPFGNTMHAPCRSSEVLAIMGAVSGIAGVKFVRVCCS